MRLICTCERTWLTILLCEQMGKGPTVTERELKDILREHALKVTGQRLELLKLLAKTKEHLDAEQIYLQLLKRKQNISRATVYRSLETLVEEGLVEKLDFGGGRMRYESSQGGDEHHDHLICTECGRVEEFL